MEYEYLEHTADLKFRSYGSSLSECLENAAKAMYNAMLELSCVELNELFEFELDVSGLESLVHDTLSELLYQTSVEHVLYSKFEFTVSEEEGKYAIKARTWGNKTGRIDKEVKAVTWHDLVVEKKPDGGWVIEVVCDT